MEIKNFVRGILPKSVWKVIRLLNKQYRDDRIRDFKGKKRKAMRGFKNSDKTYYLIRRVSPVEGHYSIMLSMLGYLKEAEEQNMIPVVDMKHYYNIIWQHEDRKGKDNAWEYFFEQPAHVSLEDIKGCRHILMSDGYNASYVPSNKETCFHRDEIAMWNRIYHQYIRFNPETAARVKSLEEELRVSQRRILGVSIRREMNYHRYKKSAEFSGYAIPPELRQVIDDVWKFLKEWNCDYVFAVTDDDEFTHVLQEEFGELLLLCNRQRFIIFKDGQPAEEQQWYYDESGDIEKQKKRHGMDYIAEITVLSKCTSLICSRNSGNTAAIIINGNQYEHLKVY